MLKAHTGHTPHFINPSKYAMQQLINIFAILSHCVKNSLRLWIIILPIMATISQLNAAPNTHRFCATMAQFRLPDSVRIKASDQVALFKKSADVFETYETPHFAIHFTRTGSEAVHLEPTDVPNQTPAFILEVEKGLEYSWSIYIDSWKMRKPKNAKKSYYMNIDNKGKYGVEILDATTRFKNCRTLSVYGVTDVGYLMIDNDFINNCTRENYTLQINDFPDTSFSYNYKNDWKIALASTLPHELFHSVQLSYTTNTFKYESWLEASAAAMEEVLSPDANDNWQYLRAYYESYTEPYFSTKENIYNGYPLPLFLHKYLGSKINNSIFEQMEQEKTLEQSLFYGIAENYSSLETIFPIYAQNIAYTHGWKDPPFLSMSDDRRYWPILDSLYIDKNAMNIPDFPIEPLSFAKLAIPKYNVDQVLTFTLKSGTSAHINTMTPTQSNGTLLKTIGQKIYIAYPTSNRPSILLSNPDMYAQSTIELSIGHVHRDSATLAYPNPLWLNKHFPQLMFSRSPVESETTEVKIVSEWGNLVHHLKFAASDKIWYWDLKDLTGAQIKTGNYFYQINQQKWKSIFIGWNSPR